MAENDDGFEIEIGEATVTTTPFAEQNFFGQLKQLVEESFAEDSSSSLTLSGNEATDARALNTARTAFYQKVAYSDRLASTLDSNPTRPVAQGGIGLPRLVRYADSAADQTEDDNPTFLIDALIYIQGVEVSQYIQGSVRVDKNTIEGHCRATFTLDNEADRFVWTEPNLRDIHGGSHPEFAKRVGQGGVTTSTGQEEVRRLFLSSKFTQNEQIKKQMYAYKRDPTRNPPVRNAKNTPVFARFDLAPNRCVFNKLDPVRVFFLYPFRVPGQKGNPELWLPEFTGYIQNVSIEDDDIRGKSSITIECVDIVEALMRRMRISTDISLGLNNPLDVFGFRPLGLDLAGEGDNEPGVDAVSQTALALREHAQSESDRFFNPKATQFYDDIVASRYGQDPFPNMPMEDAVKELLIFKESNLESGAGNRGVRNVHLGGTFLYNSTQSKDLARNYLASWHKFCLFGVKRRPWTREEVETVGQGTTSDGPYSPNNIRLWFLLPKEGTGSKNTADLSTISAPITQEINWSTRQDYLRKLVQSLDYRMYVSPTGDLICEFPMADFRPEDFGEFKESFRINKGLVSSNFGDEQEEPLAGLIVTTGFGQGAVVPEGPAAVAFTRCFVFSPFIAARYGISLETTQIPQLLAKDKAVAQQRGVIEFQKHNARCNALNMTFTYRPFLLPNRPLHHLRRTRMGLAVSVETTLTLGLQPKGESSVGLEHVRLFTGHYRSHADLENLNDLQRAEVEDAGMSSAAEALRGIDVTTSNDPIELQVFTTVMAGESMPISARVGWGVEGGKGLLAPAAGVYVLDPLDIMRDNTPTSVETGHEEQREAVGATAEEVPAEEPKDDEDKFSHNPLDQMLVTSPFGLRTNPKPPPGTKNHRGYDLRAAVGDNVYAPADGVIAAAGHNIAGKGGGVAISLDTDNNYNLKFLHLSEVIASPGQKVKAGEVIGKTGDTGRVTGPHLHLQALKKGQGIVDPEPLFPGPTARRGKRSA